MNLFEFNRIINQIKEITPYIYLHVQGEPLLHPQLNEILNICDQNNMKVQLVTNGIELKKSFFILNHPSLRKLSISIQSIEFNNISIEEYTENIFKLINKISNGNTINCELRFWREDQLNMNRTKKCLELIKNRYNFEETKKKNSYKIANHVYIDFSPSFEWPNLNEKNINEVGYCHGGIDQIAILSDGTVTACCLDANGEINFGNIFNESLSTILNNERYQNMINNLKKHKLIEPLCKKCTYRQKFH